MSDIEIKSSSSEAESLADDDEKDEDAVKFKEQVLRVFQQTTGYSQFAVSKELEGAPLLVIEIENIGPVHFPLYEEKAKSIVASFEQSPFGKRMETIVDTSIRNSKQIDPRGFKILNESWESYLENEILGVIAKEMPINTAFKASLYKMLLYEPGSFFKPHRDTEKEDGMFGTLVIQLPSKYAGGELLVKHENTTRRFDFSSIGHKTVDREFKMFFAAFYCDCQHEILPVTEGYRVCLVYNLVSVNTRSLPVVPMLGRVESQLLSLVQNWVEGTPSKVVYVLSHKYTKKALSFSNLKGKDRSVAMLLKNVSEKCPMRIYLTLFSKHVSGGAEGYEDDYDLIDTETSYTLSNLQNLISVSDVGELQVSFCNEVIPTGCFRNTNPHKEEYHEHTGNEGATADKWYRAAALVFWPDEHTPHVLDDGGAPDETIIQLFLESHKMFVSHSGNSIGLPVVLKWLNVLLKKKNLVLSTEHATKVLSSVISLGKIDLLQSLLENLNVLSLTDFSSLLEQCEKYGWESLGPSVVKMMDRCSSRKQGIEKLLLLLPEEHVVNPKKKILMKKCLNNVLKFEEKRPFYGLYYWQRTAPKPSDDKSFYYDVFLAGSKLDYDLSEYAKNKPLLIAQVLLELSEIPLFSKLPVWKNSAEHCAKLLHGIAVEPIPKINWSRKETWSCDCGDCLKLKEFLTSNRIKETFKIGKMRRLHLHQKMNDMTDLTHETMRVGNPQTLVVTKTTGTLEKKKNEKTEASTLLPNLMKVADPENAFDFERPTKIIKLEKGESS